jgi:hypothetical protein
MHGASKASYESDKEQTKTTYSEEIGKKLQRAQRLSHCLRQSGSSVMSVDGLMSLKLIVRAVSGERTRTFSSRISRQILIEVHSVSDLTAQFFEDMHAEGYVIFHKEPNIQWSGGACTEFSFLKLAKDYFV